jgi:Zn finger protein HypA/HybF involved in hydrogenase expression
MTTTSKPPIDLTPSWIAKRLLTPAATACDRAIVEAMAERGIAVVHEVGTPVGTFFAIERAMVRAAEQVIAQHNVRCGRALEFLKNLRDEPEALDKIDGVEVAVEGAENEGPK